eukprot:13090481-Ditylum_brightwellii.AAC.1
MVSFALEYMCLPIFAIAGGVLSSQIGTGADVASYLYGSIVSTITSLPRYGNKTKTCDNALTAVSVVVMASTSVFGSILRATTTQDADSVIREDVLHAVFACAPVVVLGAPVGSLFLTRANKQRLRYIFYALGILQLCIFGAIKIGSNLAAWLTVLGSIIMVLGAISIHYVVTRQTDANTTNKDIEIDAI